MWVPISPQGLLYRGRDASVTVDWWPVAPVVTVTGGPVNRWPVAPVVTVTGGPVKR
jgi:hypothetical protein